jgi:UDP-N-acetylglucosamine--N-acetylmuramyl-(pentapeptide) pyrophosphoryl-undecaprenol N-acetylglucosamine transferase
MSLKIVIACGGTGGHLFPGIAVAQAAQARGHSCIVLISEKQIDALASEGHDDLRFEKLPAIAMPPIFSLKMIKFIWKFFQTTKACKKLLTDFKTDVVLGMGGFTSLPPLYAGRKMKLKTLLHESNAFPGKANRLSSKFCDLVLLGLGDAATHFPAAKTSVVGTPLRSALRAKVDPAAAWEFFQLKPGIPVLLVMGGSQGARGVNESVLAALTHLDPQTLQIIHLSGPQEIVAVRKAYAESPFTAHVAPFCQRMELAYAIASVCISRAGASSLTELSAFALPTILIPYPFAADDHQTKNAEVFVRAKAALMVQERDLTGGRLAALLNDLLNNQEVRTSLATNMAKLGHLDSAEKVCVALERLVKN